MPALFVLPRQVPLSSSAGLLAGAKLTFSATGSSTLQNTYSDIALTTPNANPVVADGNGVFAKVYLDPSLPNYRVKLTTSANVLIYQEDDVPSNQNTAQTFRLKSATPQLIFEETDASAGNKKWRWQVNGESITFDLGNDAESVWTTVLTIPRTGVWNFNTAQLTIGALRVITGATSTFTGTLTGMTTTVTGTIRYDRAGGFIALTVPSAITGTSNATSFTLTGLPNEIQLSDTHSGVCLLRDNGADLQACAYTVQGSVVTFYKLSGSAYSASGFTGSGSKGLPASFTLIYRSSADPF